MKLSIDIVIPSFRLEESFVVPLLSLIIPTDVSAQFILIVDDPNLQPSPGIRSIIDNTNLSLRINSKNLGAGQSRNAGIDMGTGEWILFLDDDVIPRPDLLSIYADAIRASPKETGFIGLIGLPAPTTAINRAIIASGSMDIFQIAAKKKSFAWGATANIIVRRSAVGGTRFRQDFPKSGGGEDVDFFLRVRQNNNDKNFICLPAAAVIHPWWPAQHNPLLRPFRYGKGNSLLARLNPRYTYYDWLNTPETVLLIFVLAPILSLIHSTLLPQLAVSLVGILLIECIASAVQTLKRSHRLDLRVIWFVICLRLAEQSGVLWERLSKGKWHEMGKRFHDDGSIKKIIFYRTNTYRIVKWILYRLLVIFLIKRFR